MFRITHKLLEGGKYKYYKCSSYKATESSSSSEKSSEDIEAKKLDHCQNK
jgi:hypothetical protein